ncbi:hypothetical protein DUHN55_21470 [Helicobacter pylori]
MSATPFQFSSSSESKASDPKVFRLLVTGGVGLYLLGSLMPSVGGVSLSVAAIPLVALPLAFALIGPRRTPRHVLFACAALFGILAYCAYFGPPPLTEYGTDKQFKLVTSTLLSALCAGVIFSFDRLRMLGCVWVLMCTALAVLTATSGEAFSAGRASVFDNNPIWLARAFASATLFAIALPAMGAHRMWRIAAIPLLVGLVLTGSRGPAVGLAAALAVLLIHSAPRLIGTLVGVGAAYGAFTIVPALSNTRIGQTIADPGTDGGNASRTDMWQSAWRIWREHPSGVGIGNWSSYSGIEPFSWPHNIWLEVAAELGTAGILALILAVGFTFRGLVLRMKVRREYRLATALLTSEAVAVSLSGDLSARTFFFLLFLGVHLIALSPKAEIPTTDRSEAKEARNLSGLPRPKSAWPS